METITDDETRRLYLMKYIKNRVLFLDELSDQDIFSKQEPHK